MASTTSSPLLSNELLARLEQLELATRKVLTGHLQGERRSKRKGHSIEFADFREYVHGDDLRFLDWNLYARLDRLFLKLFLDEEDLHFHALVDCSRSMDFGSPTKLHFAKQLAAALGVIGLQRVDRVRVDRLGSGMRELAPTWRGRSQMRRLIDHVDQMEMWDSAPDLRESMKRFLLKNRGTGILVILTDLMDKQGYEAALRAIAGRRLDVYLIHILSREEIEPPLHGDLKLVDVEDADFAEVSISRSLLERYRKTVAAFLEQAQTFCAARGITYVRALSDQPVDNLVSQVLRRRGLVK
ncbi:MAG: DUF58 domain-containing protein [Planctomycetales bacterium]|nr:DUF58 domain-containing protein [Planctomycetales bacterium]